MPARAEAADGIPAYEVLSCEHDCPPFTPATALNKPAPLYPKQFTNVTDVYVEALVDVDFTISTDGSVKNPVVEFLLGPPPFAKSVLYAVSQRTYQPATEGGIPVEENHRIRFMFAMRDISSGARKEVGDAYAKAIGLAKDGKTADAIALLNETAAKPLLNFYERTILAYTLATIEMSTGDYWTGRNNIRIATIDEGHYLDKRVIDNAIRLRIALEALNGEFAESFAWFDILNKRAEVKGDDPMSLLVERLHSAILGTAALTLDARIPLTSDPENGGPAFWQHTLLRRSFEFNQVDGTLDHFDLLCNRHSIRSPVSAKADWTVPANWGGCVINVYGVANTKFQFLEMPPPNH
jgi:hypothetical protein